MEELNIINTLYQFLFDAGNNKVLFIDAATGKECEIRIRKITIEPDNKHIQVDYRKKIFDNGKVAVEIPISNSLSTEEYLELEASSLGVGMKLMSFNGLFRKLDITYKLFDENGAVIQEQPVAWPEPEVQPEV